MSQFTGRQKAYQQSLHTRRPYTPQMILGGEVSIKATRQGKVKFAIAKLAKQQAAGPDLSLTRAPDSMQLQIAAGEAPKNGAIILIADYMPGVQQVAVKGGDNAGKTMDQVNMVTNLRQIGIWTGEAMSLDIPLMENGSCVAILQANGPGKVLAIAKLAG
jgi:hypothetical protein